MTSAPISPMAVPTKGGAPARQRPAPAGGEVLDERTALARFDRLRKLITIQTWVIVALTIVFVVAIPFAQPVYLYYAREPDNKMLRMVGLDMPNMTNRAVVSWATTSITEIMTMGFGDKDIRLPQQRNRFTEEGWEAYQKAFVKQSIGETFKQSQLVLTTVPSNTPVIVRQGVNADNIYQWVVQMPVIMTYATNNNATRRQNAIVSLTIVRVPGAQSSAGIGIKSWSLI